MKRLAASRSTLASVKPISASMKGSSPGIDRFVRRSSISLVAISAGRSPLQRDVERQLCGRSAHPDEWLPSRCRPSGGVEELVPVRSTYPPLLWEELGLEFELDDRWRTGIPKRLQEAGRYRQHAF